MVSIVIGTRICPFDHSMAKFRINRTVMIVITTGFNPLSPLSIRKRKNLQSINKSNRWSVIYVIES